MQKTLVSDDPAYLRCKDYLKPGDRPLKFQSRTEFGCPYDCGLCPDHEQHSCLALIEINEALQSRLPGLLRRVLASRKAIAASPRSRGCSTRWCERGRARPGADLGRRADHPSADSSTSSTPRGRRPIRHVMLNTNGIRIAQDRDFVRALAELKPGFEVYLQFDSLSAMR